MRDDARRAACLTRSPRGSATKPFLAGEPDSFSGWDNCHGSVDMSSSGDPQDGERRGRCRRPSVPMAGLGFGLGPRVG